jgi:hypothetical protein
VWNSLNVYKCLTYDYSLAGVLFSSHGTEKKQFFASLAARGAAEGKVYDSRSQEVNKC